MSKAVKTKSSALKIDFEYEYYWKKLCKKHTRQSDGVKCCYTTKCPFAKKYTCYVYENFYEFMRQNSVTQKAIKRELTMIAREEGWVYDEDSKSKQ